MSKPHVEGPDFDRMAEDRLILDEVREYRSEIKSLLAALRVGVEYVARWAEAHPEDLASYEAMNAMDSAIAKATGVPLSSAVVQGK